MLISRDMIKSPVTVSYKCITFAAAITTLGAFRTRWGQSPFKAGFGFRIVLLD